MARVIFPSGGAFKAAKPQYVQAYRRPQRQQSNWLTDATRAVDLVGKVVDNPLVTYITNEIYNASRDMDPEEIAQKAMQKREEAQRQRQAPQLEEPSFGDAGTSPMLRQGGIGLQGGTAPQMSLMREFEGRPYVSRPSEVSVGDLALPEPMIRDRETGVLQPRPPVSLTPGLGSQSSLMKDQLQFREPQAPQALAGEQADPVVSGVVDVLSPVMPAEATGAARVTAAKRAINGVGKRIRDSLTKKFRESGKIEDHNLLLMGFNNELVGRAWANLIATGSPHGRIPWDTAYKAAEELHDRLSAQNRRPVELPQMREFRSLSDIAAFAMKNPGLNEEQIKALVRRGGEVAKLTTGIRGLSGARERGEEKTLSVLMKIVGGTKGISTKDRIAQIKQIAESFMEVDKELFKKIRMTPVKEPKKASGTGGAGKQGKGSGDHPDIVVVVARDKSGKPIKKRVPWQEAHDKGYKTVNGASVPDPDSKEASGFGLSNQMALKFRNSRAKKDWISNAARSQTVGFSGARLGQALEKAREQSNRLAAAEKEGLLLGAEKDEASAIKAELEQLEGVAQRVQKRLKDFGPYGAPDDLESEANRLEGKIKSKAGALAALHKAAAARKKEKAKEVKPPATDAPATGTSRANALDQ